MLLKRQMKIRVEVNVRRNAQLKQDALAYARGSLFAIMLVLSLACVSMAQTGSATLRISVEDPNKATVPKATVTLTSERTGEQRQAETNNDGSVTFASLTPGLYKLRVEA